MERKQKEQIIIVVTIVALILMFIGISYAYFTSVNNVRSGSSIVAVGGKMTIDYQDGNSSLLLAENIKPSNDILIDKTFTLTGVNTVKADGGLTMPFSISLEYQNTFQNGELMYFIKRMDENENVVANIIDIYGDGAVAEDWGLPNSVLNYNYGPIENWSGNKYTQEIANGYFKPSNDKQTVTFNLKMMFLDTGENQNYNKGATFSGKIVVGESKDVKSLKFDNDSWEEIADNVKNGNGSKYSVGSEKEVEIDGTSYTVRVANNTIPSECSGSDFSETACGFVVEFVDIVELKSMNGTDTNVGGWEASELRTYVNGNFLNKLPSDLQKVIIDTKVISGHGSTSGETNFTTTDKIYLLSPHEIWEDGIEHKVSEDDTAWNNTRQLDYYKERNVTAEEHYINAIKRYRNDTNDYAVLWWLRAVYFSIDDYFKCVSENGSNAISLASYTYGLAPAFRIG